MVAGLVQYRYWNNKQTKVNKMRKIHQKIGNTVKTFLESIENGSTKTDFKKVNRNTVIGLQRSSDLCRHPIEAIHGVEWCVTIQYCYTGIVTVGITENKTMYCYINTGGYTTKTTKEYINAALSALGFPYHLRIKNYTMQIIGDNGEVVPGFYTSYLLAKQL